jgi:hypothetical protein
MVVKRKFPDLARKAHVVEFAYLKVIISISLCKWMEEFKGK